MDTFVQKGNLYIYLSLTCILSCNLSGSRDRTGRAVVEVHAGRQEWNSPLVSAQGLCELLLYLHSVPRYWHNNHSNISPVQISVINMALLVDVSHSTSPCPMNILAKKSRLTAWLLNVLVCNMWLGHRRAAKYYFYFYCPNHIMYYYTLNSMFFRGALDKKNPF